MANSLANIMPKILARGLMVLRERAIMPRLVNSSFSSEATERGTLINVPIPAAVATRAVTAAEVPPAPVDVTPGLVQIPLDQWRQNDPIHLTDKEMVEIDARRHFLPMQLEEAVKALANEANDFIWDQFKGVFGYVGKTDGSAEVDPFNVTDGVTDATDARKVLNKQLCPRDLRRGVVDFDAEANMLALDAFRSVEKVGDREALIAGEVGRRFGIEWFADDAVPVHTAGSFLGTPLAAALEPVGETSIAMDGFTVSETGVLLEGDIISFAGHDQTYVVTADVDSDGGGLATVVIQPPLIEAVPDTTVVTMRASHKVNMVFHRDAFAFAMRPLAQRTENPSGSVIQVMTDPVTLISLRLEFSRQHKQNVWEFDLLYGAKLVRPELAARIGGAI